MRLNVATIAFFVWALLMWVTGHTIEASIIFAVGLALLSIESAAHLIIDEYFGRKKEDG